MIIKLSNNLQIKLRRPIVFLANQNYELTFRLTGENSAIPISLANGYRVRKFEESAKPELLRLFDKCGFDFSLSRLDKALDICLPGGVFLVEHSESGTLVSTMMARHLSSPEFPFGGRIDWLASDPGHRNKGLGRLSATLATNHLIRNGYQNIWVTTQPHRLGAIKIFTSLGFEPTTRTLREYPWDEISKAVTKHADV